MHTKTALLAGFLAASLFASASGSAIDRLARVDTPNLGAIKADSREPVRSLVVQDETIPKARGTQDARIVEYLEMHGRATDWSGRATLMPWSALKQIAN